MPKSLTSLDAHTEDILSGRRKASEFRFKPIADGVERVDAILRDATSYLAERLASDGFKPSLSQLSLTRRIGDLTHIVRLRPAGENLSGVSAEVSVHVLVKSQSLKRWTQALGTKYSRDLLLISQLGYLAPEHAYYKWQLVDPDLRQTELDDMEAHIRKIALPALAGWRDRTSISQAVLHFIEVDRLDWLMEAALWAGFPGVAAELVHQYLNANPKDAGVYSTELARFKANPEVGEPLPHPMSGAAFLAARHGLPSTSDA